MKNRKIILVVATLLMMMLLAACGSGNDNNKDEATGNDQAQTNGGENKPAENVESIVDKVLNEPVELMFYMTSNGVSEEDFMERYGNKIKEKFPNYTIKYTMQESGAKTLETMVATNETVDIMLSSIGLTPAFLLKYDLKSDIEDLIKKYNYDYSHLEPSTIEIQKQLANGGIYGLPYQTTSLALFYNKSLFDKFAIDYPRTGMTWDELYDLAGRMSRSEGGQSYKGLAFAFQHAMFLNQLSAAHVDEKTNKSLFTTNEFTRAFENMARFYTIPGNELPGNKFSLGNQQNPFYRDQTTAMLITLSGAGKTYADLMDWDVVQIPYFEGMEGVGPQSYPTYAYITNMSKNRDAAFQVLTYLASEEFQEWQIKTGVPSVLKDQSKIAHLFGQDEGFYQGKNIGALLPEKFASPTMKTEFQPIADAEILKALNDYSTGKDVNTVLREAAERTDALIAAELK